MTGLEISSQSTDLHWRYRRNSQNSSSLETQINQSANKTTKPTKLEAEIPLKAWLTCLANSQSITLWDMWAKETTFNTSCAGRATQRQMIRWSRLNTFSNTSLLAVDVEPERMTPCTNGFTEQTAAKDSWYPNNQHRRMAETPRMKYRIIANELWSGDTKIPKKLEKSKN